ncbi:MULTISPECIES: TDP-N-acetylfucosamine:lipid II N-acetylfucosaminyltransferase [Acinetobacter]|uniref:TDP-N-acetylfucosamine:lipid II N-acetylfucosaminyltransferase n=1 Tax=Acinetobacter TaxID=469 RepID=UPI00257FFE12|nr:TDP-N-acetylfucosamine:lipid II N-acetylfucosaminyltransferase [Acinetobacter sp. UBA5984]
MRKLKKVLHLSTDDKFVDMALSVFNTFDDVENSLIVYSRSKKLKYVKNIATVINNPNRVVSYVNSFDLIIVHSLSPVWGKLLLKMKKEIPIVWIGWGYDYYDIIGNQLYLNDTKKLFDNCVNVSLLGLLKIKFIAFCRRIWRIRFDVKQENVIERINYFSPVLDLEYEMVKKNFNGAIFPKYIEFNYGNLEEYFAKKLEDKRINGHNILVGNSSSYSNNHVEAFKLLKEIGVKTSKIICPLSYGDDKYRTYIEKKGEEYFGDDFTSLKDFMPLEDYMRVIGSCRYAIMNHCRQQAYGNIVTLLYLGAKVFLRVQNPLYIYLISKGMNIYSIQDLEDKKCFGDILDEDEILHNRNVLKLLLSKEKVINHVKKILEIPEKV